MDDQFDDKLKQRIKEVFDGYHDSSAAEGWLQLREKFPERKRRRIILWIWLAAAVLLLFVGISLRLYLVNNKQADNKIARNNKGVPQPSKPLPHQQKSLADQQEADTKTNSVIGNTGYTTSAVNKIRDQLTIENTAMALASSKKRNPKISKQMLAANSQASRSSHADVHQSINQSDAVTAAGANTSATANNTASIAGVKQNAAMPDTPEKKTADAQLKNAKTIDHLFATDNTKSSGDLSIHNDRRALFGIYASTYFNYAKGSNNQVNVGAGFTADIAISKNLRMVTGFSVNQNSFAYNSSSGSNAIFPLPVNFISNTPANKDYAENASLLGVDIPLDLKYNLNYPKIQIYFLAGVGSGSFINESYAVLNSSGSTKPLTDSKKGLNDFYFARRLNLALGLGYPLGKDQIVIEPFVKYPLQGLGAKQLRFGASGVNLKFNFATRK